MSDETTDEKTFTQLEAEFLAGFVFGRVLAALQDKIPTDADMELLRGYIDAGLHIMGKETYLERQGREEIEHLLNGTEPS